uniref:helix-turn-helix domain-containing protein n=1 Tax=Streptomyces roseoverticillatus TaxID=66429 RepID=UPI001F39F313|nr:helix-turn-helix domain-containing protein [Streptomyces roseoverticillatus]
MRYPQGGGLTAERRAFRERIRLEAAELFAVGESSAVIARTLRVSVRSVQRWRKAYTSRKSGCVRLGWPGSMVGCRICCGTTSRTSSTLI